MFQKEWEVLVVDDDPDVLAVSKLALRSVKVYGVPLKIHTCGSMAEAVEQAAALARPGDVALLSPACASFDMYDSFAHRGRVFKECVRGYAKQRGA